MYGRIGQEHNDEAAAANPDTTGWMSGGFGLIGADAFNVAVDADAGSGDIGSGEPGSRIDGRRLSVDGVDPSMLKAVPTLQMRLYANFTDRLACIFLSFGVVATLQYIALGWWLLRANRKYYKVCASHPLL